MDSAVWTDRVAAPLDGVRRATLVAVGRTRLLRPVLASRDARVAFVIGAHAATALVLTVLFPAPLFVLLPLVLGVPHVVQDIRYLLLRTLASRRARVLVLSTCAAAVAMIAASLSGARFDVARAELVLGMLALAAATAGAMRLGTNDRLLRVRGTLVLAAIVTLFVAASYAPRLALVVALHVHNLVAWLLWPWVFRARIRSVLLPLALVAVATLLLVAGAFLPFTLHFGVWQAFGTNLLAAADVLAPGLPDKLAVGLTSSWIFLQSLHYLVWLVLVPTDSERGSGATSFRTSLRAVLRDLGVPGFVLAVVSFAVFAALGVGSPLATRNAYLALASFHVWLELAVLAHCAVRGPRAFASPVAG